MKVLTVPGKGPALKVGQDPAGTEQRLSDCTWESTKEDRQEPEKAEQKLQSFAFAFFRKCRGHGFLSPLPLRLRLKRPFINSNSTVHKEKEMVSFRKGILLLALLAFAASFASAQFGPLNCTLNGGAPPLLRAEGLSEEVGQAFIQCTGGNPFAPALINVRVFTPGYNVTSRLLGAPNAGKLEATLLIDDPAPGTVNVGTNAFFADPVPGNSQAVEWKNITFNPPGTAGVTRTLRMVNIRVNASAAGLTVTPTPVNLLVSVTGSLTLPLQSPFLVVGYIQKSLEVTVTGATLSQCQPPTDPVVVRFKELIPNAWRTAGNVAGSPQNNLFNIYNTESMYWDDTTGVNWPADAGRATQATQLQIVFANLPAGVSLGSASWSGSTTTFTSTTSGNTVTLTVATTPGAALGTSETLDVSIPVVYPTPPALPAIGTGTVAGSYAPVSTTITPITSPVPRFTDTGSQTAAFTIGPCETRLLFPFVTSITGWDTGLAISNTSKDPWSTGNQSGTCTLYFYGTPGNSNQTTSVSIAAGQQMLMTLSGGNPAQGLSAVPGFTGYVIAVCNFQYAHGYAFISDLGANKFAQGYIALILGDHSISNTSRYGPSPSEMLNQ